MKAEANKQPPAEELRRLFEYRDGELFYRVARAKKPVGYPCGRAVRGRYKYVRLNGRYYRAHRVIYAMHYGDFEGWIDHINGDPTDNRIENLRLATHSQNIANSKLTRPNKHGFRGVRYKSARDRYVAVLKVDGKTREYGWFRTAAEAHELYKVKAKEAFGEFARLD